MKTRINFSGQLTIPDFLSLLRIVGSFGLAIIAAYQAPYVFVGVYLFLGFTDLVDGPIARYLKQTSVHGAKLDTIADVLLSCSLLVGVVLLRGSLFLDEIYWVGAAVFSYVFSFASCLIRFGKMPAFHTYAAKANHFIVAISGVVLIIFGSAWPLRVAAWTTLATNIEISAIVFWLKRYQTDIGSILRLWSRSYPTRSDSDSPADIDEN